MRFQFSLRSLLVFVTAVAAVCGLGIALLTWLTTIAKLDLGNGRTAVIGSDGSADVLIPVYCKVVASSGKTLFPWTYIGDAGTLDEDRRNLLEFSVVSADGGQLVGIVENHNPDTIIALYDFKTNQSWSDLACSAPSEAAAYAEAWKQARLQELPSAYPGRQFELTTCDELGIARREGISP